MKPLLFVLTLSVMLTACAPQSNDRSIPFEGIANARDLGGLVMTDGRTVRPGLLVRSGNLSRATDADVRLLQRRYHLTDVFDFRYDAEAAADPDREIEGVRYTHLSTLPQRLIDVFSSGRADSTQVKSDDFMASLAHYAFNTEAQQMARQLYPIIIADSISQRRYGDFLRGVLAAEGGSLWHCSQGKDRAGWGTAFVLAALGAPRETIIADFDLSNRSYIPYVEQLSAQIDSLGGGEPEKAFIRAMVGVSTENFASTLDLIDQRYGSLSSYIETALGFPKEEQEKLRNKYLKN